MKCKYEICCAACVYLQDAKITFSTLPEFFSFSTDSQSSTRKKNMLSVCMSQTITCCKYQDGSRPAKHSSCLWVFVILRRKKEAIHNHWPVLSCQMRIFQISPRLASVSTWKSSRLFLWKAPSLWRWREPLLFRPYRLMPTWAVVPGEFRCFITW